MIAFVGHNWASIMLMVTINNVFKSEILVTYKFMNLKGLQKARGPL